MAQDRNCILADIFGWNLPTLREDSNIQRGLFRQKTYFSEKVSLPIKVGFFRQEWDFSDAHVGYFSTGV
jgi:hypothetical protein